MGGRQLVRRGLRVCEPPPASRSSHAGPRLSPGSGALARIAHSPPATMAIARFAVVRMRRIVHSPPVFSASADLTSPSRVDCPRASGVAGATGQIIRLRMVDCPRAIFAVPIARFAAISMRRIAPRAPGLACEWGVQKVYDLRAVTCSPVGSCKLTRHFASATLCFAKQKSSVSRGECGVLVYGRYWQVAQHSVWHFTTVIPIADAVAAAQREPSCWPALPRLSRLLRLQLMSGDRSGVLPLYRETKAPLSPEMRWRYANDHPGLGRRPAANRPPVDTSRRL